MILKPLHACNDKSELNLKELIDHNHEHSVAAVGMETMR